MHIPRYWAKAERPAADGNLFEAWASSEVSEEDAYRQACERVARIETYLKSGADFPEDYGYGRYPAREELLEELYDERDETVAMTTRNRYGCRVLNTARLMILDVDVPLPGWVDRIAAWLGRRRVRDADAVLVELRATLAGFAPASFRIYRTAAGFRVMATDREYEPASAEVARMMEAVGVDKAYRRLCRQQECFRARLSPKPWRVGVERPTFKFPCDTEEQARRMESWVKEYEQRLGGYAVCQYLETVGDGVVHPGFAGILELHDAECGARGSLPLA